MIVSEGRLGLVLDEAGSCHGCEIFAEDKDVLFIIFHNVGIEM